MRASHQRERDQAPGSPLRAGFTLVELLVVIGIIGLLVGILLPALGRAREHARIVQCASNIRQICQAVLMYAAVNHGVLPTTAHLPDPMLAPEDIRTFAIRMDDVGRINFNDGGLWSYLSPLEVRQQVFLCPTDSEPRYPKIYMQPIADRKYTRNFSYSFTGYLHGNAHRNLFTGETTWTGLRLSQVRRSPHKILVIEEEMPQNVQGLIVAAWGANAPYVDGEPKPVNPPPVLCLLTRRHLGMANEGFFDGPRGNDEPADFSRRRARRYHRGCIPCAHKSLFRSLTLHPAEATLLGPIRGTADFIWGEMEPCAVARLGSVVIC